MRYHAKRADGFASLLERAVFYKLRDREILGLIKDIKRQQVVILEDLKNGERRNWKVDFSAVDILTDKTFFIEAKGYENNDYLRKRNMWRKNPPARLEIWKGNYRNPRLVEVIEPYDRD